MPLGCISVQDIQSCAWLPFLVCTYIWLGSAVLIPLTCQQCLCQYKVSIQIRRGFDWKKNTKIHLRPFWLCLFPFFLGSVFRACWTSAPKAPSFIVSGTYCWMTCSSSSLSICILDKSPAAVERTLVSLTYDFENCRLLIPFLTELERRLPRLATVLCSKLGASWWARRSSFGVPLMAMAWMSSEVAIWDLDKIIL